MRVGLGTVVEDADRVGQVGAVCLVTEVTREDQRVE